MDSFQFSIFIVLISYSGLLVQGQEKCTPCGCVCYYAPSNLDCSGREITNVTECFPELSPEAFSSLDFSNNSLQGTLDLNIVKGNILQDGAYCRLNFTGNEINTFRYESGNSIYCDQTLSLDLSHNSFTELSSQTFLFRLRLLSSDQISLSFQYNKIKYVQDNFLGNITGGRRIRSIDELRVDLSNNRITHINSAFYLPRELYGMYGRYSVRKFVLLLHDNNITCGSFVQIIDGIQNMYNSIEISLRNNSIKGLNESIADRIPADRPTSLDLSKNPWNCNCSQRFASYNTSNFRAILSDPSSVGPICQKPSTVSRRPLLSLSSEEFSCGPAIDPEAELDLTVDPGDDVELRCPFLQGESPVGVVNWHYERRNIVDGMVQVSVYEVNTCSDCPLIIGNIREGEQGEYRCTVTDTNDTPLTITQTVRLNEIIRTTTAENPESDISGGSSIGLIILGVLLFLLLVALIVTILKFWMLRKRYMEVSCKLSPPVTYKKDGPTLAVPVPKNVALRVEEDESEDLENYEVVEDPSKRKIRGKSNGGESNNAYVNDWRVNDVQK